MNIIDSILLLLLCLFGLRGYFKGLFREAFSFLGLVIGFGASVRYDRWVAETLTTYHYLPAVAVKPVSFIAIFLLVYFAFSLTGWILHRFAQFLLLHGVDRAGGVLIGTGKGLAILALLLFLLSAFPLLPQPVAQKLTESYFAGMLTHAAGGLLKGQKHKIFFPDSGQEEKVDQPKSI